MPTLSNVQNFQLHKFFYLDTSLKSEGTDSTEDNGKDTGRCGEDTGVDCRRSGSCSRLRGLNISSAQSRLGTVTHSGSRRSSNGLGSAGGTGGNTGGDGCKTTSGG